MAIKKYNGVQYDDSLDYQANINALRAAKGDHSKLIDDLNRSRDAKIGATYGNDFMAEINRRQTANPNDALINDLHRLRADKIYTDNNTGLMDTIPEQFRRKPATTTTNPAVATANNMAANSAAPTPAPIAYTPPDMTKNINDLAAAQQQSKLTALDRAKNKSLAELDRQKAAIRPVYYDAKNQAATQNAMAAKSFRDYIASRGLKRSGVADQGRMDNAVALQNSLTSLNREEAAKLADIESKRAELTQDYIDQGTQAQSEIEAQKMQQLLEQGRFDQNQLLNIAGLTGVLGGQRTIAGQQLDNQVAQQAIQNRMAEAGLTGLYGGQKTIQGRLADSNLATDALNREGMTLNNQASSLKNQYLPNFLEQELTSNELSNEGKRLTNEGQQRQNTSLDLLNEKTRLEISYLPQQQQLAVQKAMIDIDNGKADVAYKNIVNSNLPEKLKAELGLIAANAYQSRATGDAALMNANTNAGELEWRKNPNNPDNIAKNATASASSGGFTNDDYYKYFNYYSDQLKPQWDAESGEYRRPNDKTTLGKQIIGSSIPSVAKQALLKDLGITTQDLLKKDDSQNLSPFHPSLMQGSILQGR